MPSYRHGAHTVFEIHLHLVWTTKYRKPMLTGEVGLRVRELVRQRPEQEQGWLEQHAVPIHAMSARYR